MTPSIFAAASTPSNRKACSNGAILSLRLAPDRLAVSNEILSELLA